MYNCVNPRRRLHTHTHIYIYIAGGRDAYFPLQIAFSIFGLLWIYLFSSRVKHISELPGDAWRTHLDEEAKSDTSEMMNGELNYSKFNNNNTEVERKANSNKKAR
jgi:hypothetical protein